MASNLADKFEEMADAVPRRLVLIGKGERVTFAELEGRANRLAHHLAAHGVGPGARVGLVARNSVPFVVSFLACFKLRAVPVNVNYRYTGYPCPVCQLSGSNVEFPHTGCDCHCSREWLAHPAPPVPETGYSLLLLVVVVRAARLIEFDEERFRVQLR